MNRDSQREARRQGGAGPQITDLRDRVPDLDDDALAVLHANALRLKASGTELQRELVAALLPVVEAELAERKRRKR